VRVVVIIVLNLIVSYIHKVTAVKAVILEYVTYKAKATLQTSVTFWCQTQVWNPINSWVKPSRIFLLFLTFQCFFCVRFSFTFFSHVFLLYSVYDFIIDIIGYPAKFGGWASALDVPSGQTRSYCHCCGCCRPL